jgi:hypothetical protein
MELEAAIRADATKGVMERPLDVRQALCSYEQYAAGTPSRRIGATHYGDT